MMLFLVGMELDPESVVGHARTPDRDWGVYGGDNGGCRYGYRLVAGTWCGKRH